jgi:hypothetical protein
MANMSLKEMANSACEGLAGGGKSDHYQYMEHYWT